MTHRLSDIENAIRANRENTRLRTLLEVTLTFAALETIENCIRHAQFLYSAHQL